MVRRFVAFDEATIKSELRSLPSDDRAALTEAMKHFQMDHGIGFQIKSYGGGIQMITGSGRDQGRGLFFMLETIEKEESKTEERLVLLLVYKKESQKMPAVVLEKARARKEKYLSK